ncbi:unnamed protein product [Ectocarpus fasciculatus]
MVPIQINIDRVQPEFVPEGTLHAVGHVWGQAVEDLLAPLRTGSSPAGLLVHENGDSSNSDRERNVDLGSEAADRDRKKNASLGSAAAEAPGQGMGTEEEVASVPGQGEGSPGGCHRAGSIGGGGGEGFDVVIMADLLFNRSQHAQLLETCDRCLLGRGSGSTATAAATAATVWVSFSHHDPEKAELDMRFFDLAKERGFVATHIKTVQMRDLFVENDGLDDLRGEVHLWCLKRR